MALPHALCGEGHQGASVGTKGDLPTEEQVVEVRAHRSMFTGIGVSSIMSQTLPTRVWQITLGVAEIPLMHTLRSVGRNWEDL